MASAKAPCLMRAVGKDKLLKINASASSPAILSVCGPAAATKMSGGFNGRSRRKPRAAGSSRKKSVSVGKSPSLTFRPANISFKKRIISRSMLTRPRLRIMSEVEDPAPIPTEIPRGAKWDSAANPEAKSTGVRAERMGHRGANVRLRLCDNRCQSDKGVLMGEMIRHPHFFERILR